MIITIDTDTMRSEYDIRLAETIILHSMYYRIMFRNISFNEEAFLNLMEKGLIEPIGEKCSDPDVQNYQLTSKGRDAVEGIPSEGNKECLFEKFISIYPTRILTPTGTRILSPASVKSKQARKLKRKWNLATNKDPELQEHVIKCLEAEVKLRERENKMEFMRGIETWLNNATWEDYAYLLDEDLSTSTPKNVRL